jgi:light-independent protochlorophyllide reductase subunit B
MCRTFPARYAPQMGFEGANVLFDTWVHPLMMGLEEHLITMFREDIEFQRRGGTVASGARGKRGGAETRADAPPVMRRRMRAMTS